MTTSFMNIDMQHLKEVYLYANTPSYLFKSLRRLASVQSLAGSSDTGKITEQLNAILSRESMSIDDMAIVYGLLVALSYKNYADIRDSLVTLKTSQLEWVAALSRLIESRSIPTTETSVTARYSVKYKLDSTSDSTSVICKGYPE